jgi:septal ring factor EnvC (AmiA/AmiB activator)
MHATSTSLMIQARQLIKDKQAQLLRNEDQTRQNDYTTSTLEGEIAKYQTESQALLNQTCAFEEHAKRLCKPAQTSEPRLRELQAQLDFVGTQICVAEEIVSNTVKVHDQLERLVMVSSAGGDFPNLFLLTAPPRQGSKSTLARKSEFGGIGKR